MTALLCPAKHKSINVILSISYFLNTKDILNAFINLESIKG